MLKSTIALFLCTTVATAGGNNDVTTLLGTLTAYYHDPFGIEDVFYSNAPEEGEEHGCSTGYTSCLSDSPLRIDPPSGDDQAWLCTQTFEQRSTDPYRGFFVNHIDDDFPFALNAYVAVHDADFDPSTDATPSGFDGTIQGVQNSYNAYFHVRMVKENFKQSGFIQDQYYRETVDQQETLSYCLSSRGSDNERHIAITHLERQSAHFYQRSPIKTVLIANSNESGFNANNAAEFSVSTSWNYNTPAATTGKHKRPFIVMQFAPKTFISRFWVALTGEPNTDSMVIAPYQNIDCDSTINRSQCLNEAIAKNKADFNSSDGYCKLVDQDDRFFHKTDLNCLEDQFGVRAFDSWIIGSLPDTRSDQQFSVLGIYAEDGLDFEGISYTDQIQTMIDDGTAIMTDTDGDNVADTITINVSHEEPILIFAIPVYSTHITLGSDYAWSQIAELDEQTELALEESFLLGLRMNVHNIFDHQRVYLSYDASESEGATITFTQTQQLKLAQTGQSAAEVLDERDFTVIINIQPSPCSPSDLSVPYNYFWNAETQLNVVMLYDVLDCVTELEMSANDEEQGIFLLTQAFTDDVGENPAMLLIEDEVKFRENHGNDQGAEELQVVLSQMVDGTNAADVTVTISFNDCYDMVLLPTLDPLTFSTTEPSSSYPPPNFIDEAFFEQDGAFYCGEPMLRIANNPVYASLDPDSWDLTIDPSLVTEIGTFDLIYEVYDEASDHIIATIPQQVTFTDDIVIIDVPIDDIVVDYCVDAAIEFAADAFETTYLVQVGQASADQPSTAEDVAATNPTEESAELMVISWPETLSSIDSLCKQSSTTTIEKFSELSLGSDWAEIDYEKGTITLDPTKQVYQSMQKSSLVRVTVKKEVVSDLTQEILATAEISFAIRFEIPATEEPDDTDDKTEDDDETVEVSIEAIAEVVQAESEQSTTFGGVDTNEKEVKKREQQELVIYEPIVATYSVASETGEIRIDFSRPVVINLPPLDESIKDEPQNRRQLQSKTYTDAEKQQLAKLIDIKYDTAAEGSEVPELATVRVIEATQTAIDLVLTYTIPAAVSKSPTDADLIEISFNESYFADPFLSVEVNSGESLIITLPRQMDAAKASELTEQLDVAENASNTFAVSNLMLQILMGASLKFLWGMINTLQFVVFFTEWKVQMPPNALMAIETFRVIALGEFIPYDWLTDPLKEALASDEADTSDGDLEDKSNVLANMGVMLVILVVLLVVSFLLVCIIRGCKKGSCCHRMSQKIKAKFFWNGILRYILQSYLKTSIGCALAFSLISWADTNSTINALMSIVFAIVLACQPILFACIMERNKDHLFRTKTKAKIGAAYLGIRHYNRAQRQYSTVFLCRRAFYAIITVVCLKQPNILVHVFLFSNAYNLVYLGFAQPHDTKLGRRVEYFNESCLQLITYHLALFPLFKTIADENYCGWSMIGVLVFVFVANLTIMIVMTISGCKRKCKLKALKKKQQKAMENIQLARLAKPSQEQSLEVEAKVKHESLKDDTVVVAQENPVPQLLVIEEVDEDEFASQPAEKSNRREQQQSPHHPQENISKKAKKSKKSARKQQIAEEEKEIERKRAEAFDGDEPIDDVLARLTKEFNDEIARRQATYHHHQQSGNIPVFRSVGPS